MTKVQVNITKNILNKSKMCGENNNMQEIASNCAIALAINKLIPNCCVGDKIYVFKDIDFSSILCAIKLPMIAHHFIRQFDRLSPAQRIMMKEISFTIEVPDEALENIDISDIFKNSKTLQLV